LNHSVVEFVAPREYMVSQNRAHPSRRSAALFRVYALIFLTFELTFLSTLASTSFPASQVRPPQPPVYTFLIDVSHHAIQSGMVTVAAKTILETLDKLPNADNRTRICIIGVDTSLHFFCLPVSMMLTNEASEIEITPLDEFYLTFVLFSICLLHFLF
jgi:hypothetical protein